VTSAKENEKRKRGKKKKKKRGEEVALSFLIPDWNHEDSGAGA